MYQHACKMDLEGIVLKRAKVAIAPAGAEAE
jgi:ATP-dependent DNA ligase